MVRRLGLAAGLAGQLLCCSPVLAQSLAGDGDVRPNAGMGGIPGGWLNGSAFDQTGLFEGPLGILPPGNMVPGVPAPAWSIAPSLGLTLTGTDNVSNTANNRRGDVYLTLSPAILVSANTARLSGMLAYNPAIRFYAQEDRLNRIDHRFNGNLRATLVEEAVYLDLLGFGTVVDPQGGLGPQSTTISDRRSAVQTTIFQVSPYVVHRFGGDATMQVGYAYRQTLQDGRAASLPGSTQPFFTRQDIAAQEVFGALRSGENFGPLTLQLRSSATTYSGVGALDGAHNYVGTVEARYALNRWVAPLLELGYEDQRYGGTQPFTVQDAIWSAGVRLTPDPYSVIILRYGHRDGYGSAMVRAEVELGARTRLSARYSDQIGTQLQRNNDLLSDIRPDPFDATTGAVDRGPLALPFVNSFLATQSTVVRSKRATVMLSQYWPRDQFSLSLLYDEQNPLTAATGTTGFAQKGVSATFSWGHDFTELTSGLASVQAGRSTRSGASSSDIFTARLRLSHRLTEMLFGWAEYGFSARTGNRLAGDVTQNFILIGLRQTF